MFPGLRGHTGNFFFFLTLMYVDQSKVCGPVLQYNVVLFFCCGLFFVFVTQLRASGRRCQVSGVRCQMVPRSLYFLLLFFGGHDVPALLCQSTRQLNTRFFSDFEYLTF